MTRLKFERCCIDAEIKGTKSDSTGNHIPLPSEWHDLFDGCTSDRVASISIVAAPGEKGLAPVDPDGRAAVLVHVYFDPNSQKAQRLGVELQGAVMTLPAEKSPDVFRYAVRTSNVVGAEKTCEMNSK